MVSTVLMVGRGFSISGRIRAPSVLSLIYQRNYGGFPGDPPAQNPLIGFGSIKRVYASFSARSELKPRPYERGVGVAESAPGGRRIMSYKPDKVTACTVVGRN